MQNTKLSNKNGLQTVDVWYEIIMKLEAINVAFAKDFILFKIQRLRKYCL